MIKRLNCLLVLGLDLCLAATALAASSQGIKMRNYSEVVIENLQIGSEYSMIRTGNLPLEVENDSNEAVFITLRVLGSEEKYQRKDYQPVPDLNWIIIEPSSATVNARATHRSDVIIRIPDDTKYLGKKFQAEINVGTQPKPGDLVSYGLAVQGRLFFTVAQVKRDAAVSPTGVAPDLSFNFDPEGRITLSDLPLGRKVPVRTKEGKSVVMENRSERKNTFILTSVHPGDTYAHIAPGYEACPDPNLLSIPKEEVTLGPGKKKPVPMFLNIPDKPEYQGKKYFFLVSISTGATGGGVRYYQVLADTVGNSISSSGPAPE